MDVLKNILNFEVVIYKPQNMEDFKKNQERDKDIVFSKSVKAGKRIYYVDVKKNRKGELFIALTESKKVISGDTESPSINFEKHKIFLYQEDFEHFMSGLEEAVNFVRAEQPGIEPRQNYNTTGDESNISSDLKINMDLNVEDIGLNVE
ncbi:hypothetical protein HMPREF9441_02300 [Paraprevotella clara YIT 11840]|uniref:PUR-alpha/beta/gamma DNA/RNA-binding protein n=2 Tax=Prevotellaceae TaxID=171552 RepID=G5SSF0_9BACT|nr:hypothetical protein HMPREF9441_02300 [Paraprevotella clara YIT 11840]